MCLHPSLQAHMLPDMAHLMFLFVVLAVMASGLANTLLGARTKVVADFGAAMYTMFKYLAVGNDSGMFDVSGAMTCVVVGGCAGCGDGVVVVACSYSRLRCCAKERIRCDGMRVAGAVPTYIHTGLKQTQHTTQNL